MIACPELRELARFIAMAYSVAAAEVIGDMMRALFIAPHEHLKPWWEVWKIRAAPHINGKKNIVTLSLDLCDRHRRWPHVGLVGAVYYPELGCSF